MKKMEKHYTPIPETIKYLEKKYKIPGIKILEIGPGVIPLNIATHYIDFVDLKIPNKIFIKLNICENKIPYPNKYFDLVYCRHTLEDIHNPEFLFEEIKRVSKAGYIETPSPIAELSRFIDSGSLFFRGYSHHRYIIWNSNNILNFLPKYPLIEHLYISDNITKYLKDKWYWNTYMLWDDSSQISHKLYYNNLDYGMETYDKVLEIAANTCIENIEETKKHIIQYLENI